jgi:DNA-binding Lrp family transcriptional regulator
MKLSTRDRSLLAACEYFPDKSAEQLARELRWKSSTVAYRLRRLRDEGIIKRRAFINVMQLGVQDFALYFSLASASPKLHSAIVSELRRSDRIAWVGTLAGDYQFQICYYATNSWDFAAFLERISDRFPGAFAEKAVAPRLAYHRYPRRYLSTSVRRMAGPVLSLRYQAPVAVDALDRRLLQILSTQAEDSLRALSQKLAVPLTTIERRLKALERSGVIAGYYYEIPLSALAVESYRILLYVRGVTRQLRRAIQEFCQRHLRVTFLIETLGAWDFEVGVETEKALKVMQIVRELYDLCGLHLMSVKVLTELEELESRYFPFTESSG